MCYMCKAAFPPGSTVWFGTVIIWVSIVRNCGWYQNNQSIPTPFFGHPSIGVPSMLIRYRKGGARHAIVCWLVDRIVTSVQHGEERTNTIPSMFKFLFNNVKSQDDFCFLRGVSHSSSSSSLNLLAGYTLMDDTTLLQFDTIPVFFLAMSSVLIIYNSSYW